MIILFNTCRYWLTNPLHCLILLDTYCIYNPA
uniref:Uncharacterized protein n=1 Tax=Rhizophora mucronata TaxID=61149 RepID=A0A2P2JK81_RHIMU